MNSGLPKQAPIDGRWPRRARDAAAVKLSRSSDENKSMDRHYTWLCPTEVDRQRLVAVVAGVTYARALMFVFLTIVTISAAGTYGPVIIALNVGTAIVSTLLYRNLSERTFPEYWAVAGWLSTQIPLGIAAALTGGVKSPFLPWLAISVVSLAARFTRNAIFAGMAFLLIMLVVVTLGVDSSISADLTGVLINAGLLISIAVFVVTMMRSDVTSRTRNQLTGLANAAEFHGRLRSVIAQRLRYGGDITVLAVALDEIDEANETLAPRAAGQLQLQAAQRISSALTQDVELIGQFSSDEFFILTSNLNNKHGLALSKSWNTPAEIAQQTAHAIHDAFSESFMAGPNELYLSTNIGIAVLSGSYEDTDLEQATEELLFHTQTALTAAKATGPSGIVVYDRDRPEARTRLSLITRLRKAIDREELLLAYQPSVNLHSGELIGVEALLRWSDPEHGMIAPLEFIGLAEETGLIEPIGEWVIEEVCRQINTWESQGLYIDVAFNISPRQLWQPALLPNMLSAFAAAGVRPQKVIVEITESSTLRDPDRTCALLQEITDKDIRLAIDDFGTGFSSLSRLRDIPAEILKIDRSFVSGVSGSPDGQAFVRAIIQLAKNLGMIPHAEGIENEDEREFLIANGCDQGQGYLFAKPMAPEDIPRFNFSSQSASGVPLLLPADTGLDPRVDLPLRAGGG
jgi:EAL domain-containing protein (putative c-di-GMP-specific phosphodiesterase class I)/GGDEF domain-containing protein